MLFAISRYTNEKERKKIALGIRKYPRDGHKTQRCNGPKRVVNYWQSHKSKKRSSGTKKAKKKATHH